MDRNGVFVRGRWPPWLTTPLPQITPFWAGGLFIILVVMCAPLRVNRLAEPFTKIYLWDKNRVISTIRSGIEKFSEPICWPQLSHLFTVRNNKFSKLWIPDWIRFRSPFQHLAFRSCFVGWHSDRYLAEGEWWLAINSSSGNQRFPLPHTRKLVIPSWSLLHRKALCLVIVKVKTDYVIRKTSTKRLSIDRR